MVPQNAVEIPSPGHRVAAPPMCVPKHRSRSLEVRMIARSFVAGCLLCGSLTGIACAESGIASVYAYSGAKTASGARADPRALTAAHRALPFGTLVKVTNTKNGNSVLVRINDRGPFVRGRIIDVTPAAARQLGFDGLARVTLSRM
jgi:rare lipoprotein A